MYVSPSLQLQLQLDAMTESVLGPRKESAGSLKVTNPGHFGAHVPWVFCHPHTVGPPPTLLEGEQYGLSYGAGVWLSTDWAVAGVSLISAGPRGWRGAEEYPRPGWRLIPNAQRDRNTGKTSR